MPYFSSQTFNDSSQCYRKNMLTFLEGIYNYLSIPFKVSVYYK